LALPAPVCAKIGRICKTGLPGRRSVEPRRSVEESPRRACPPRHGLGGQAETTETSEKQIQSDINTTRISLVSCPSSASYFDRGLALNWDGLRHLGDLDVNLRPLPFLAVNVHLKLIPVK